MTIQEIEKLTKAELVELLEPNTEQLRYKADDILILLDTTLEEYKLHRNYVMEKRSLWSNIFVYLFEMSPALVDAIIDKMNWLEFIMWSENNLLKKPEIDYIVKSYYELKKEHLSISSVINEMISSVLMSLTEIQPDQIEKLFDQLEDRVKSLPDIIKEDL
jgi:Glu-tRNA(Gln) amidotransferase subunit E-like FAD-binding protein